LKCRDWDLVIEVAAFPFGRASGEPILAIDLVVFSLCQSGKLINISRHRIGTSNGNEISNLSIIGSVVRSGQRVFHRDTTISLRAMRMNSEEASVRSTRSCYLIFI